MHRFGWEWAQQHLHVSQYGCMPAFVALFFLGPVSDIFKVDATRL
jgi:hypothetical protein